MVLPYYILVPRTNVIQRFEEESSWQEIVIVEMLQTDAGDELWTVDVLNVVPHGPRAHHQGIESVSEE